MNPIRIKFLDMQVKGQILYLILNAASFPQFKQVQLGVSNSNSLLGFINFYACAREFSVGFSTTTGILSVSV